MNKEDFLEKAQKTIDKQETKLEKLKEKLADESNESTYDIKEAINSLEPKLEEAKAKAGEIADGADDTWEDLKDSVESGWDEMASQLEEGWDNLTDSIKSMFS